MKPPFILVFLFIVINQTSSFLPWVLLLLGLSRNSRTGLPAWRPLPLRPCITIPIFVVAGVSNLPQCLIVIQFPIIRFRPCSLSLL